MMMMTDSDEVLRRDERELKSVYMMKSAPQDVSGEAMPRDATLPRAPKDDDYATQAGER